MPTLNIENIIENIDILFWKIEEEETDLISLFPQFYSLEDLFNLKSISRRKEFLAIRLLIAYKFDFNERIIYNVDRKPFLLVNKNIHISISHTQNFAAVSFSPLIHGIDIEYYSDKAYRCRDYFLSPQEKKILIHSDLIKNATCLWSCKEAIFKKYSSDHLNFKQDIILQQKNNKIIALINHKVCILFYSFKKDFVLTCAY